MHAGLCKNPHLLQHVPCIPELEPVELRLLLLAFSILMLLHILLLLLLLCPDKLS
jgi:hypothetical protein